MKILTVYYSRTGKTKKIAEKISKELNSDIDEISDLKKRSGILGFLGGGRDAFFKKSTKIKFIKDPSKYDIVIIGTPIWAGTCVPAVREYLKKNKIKKTAFFCTAGSKQAKAWKDMEELSSKPIATLDIKDKKVDSFDKEIRIFCKKVKS
ncbi:flavodoxin [Candidatus Woesearchaeota archaeon]|nr:flavodoxin [Candidatus Woesearchaeota archaeon]